MTNYEVFKRAAPENMAASLASMAASLANVKDPREIRRIYNVYLELLGKETELAFLVEGETKETRGDDVVLGHFGQRLRAARRTKGLTQQGMADLLVVPVRAIHSWETGERTPPEYVQRLILRALEGRRE